MKQPGEPEYICPAELQSITIPSGKVSQHFHQPTLRRLRPNSEQNPLILMQNPKLGQTREIPAKLCAAPNLSIPISSTFQNPSFSKPNVRPLLPKSICKKNHFSSTKNLLFKFQKYKFWYQKTINLQNNSKPKKNFCLLCYYIVIRS